MNLWEQILARVETKVNRHSFYTWFKPTTFIGADSRTISVRVPNPLFKDWLTKHYSVVIAEALGEVQKPGLDVSFVAEPQAEAALAAMGGAEDSLPLKRAALAAGPGPAGLNPRYTFDTFIVGSRISSRRGAARSPRRLAAFLQPAVHLRGWGWGRRTSHAIGQYVLRHDRSLKPFTSRPSGS
jgi:chromosomal replication initiator protein